MNPSFLDFLKISDHGLTQDSLNWLDERTLVVKKWQWDYEKALNFQRTSVKLLQDFPRMRVLICCNHPRVLTNGRGLQRPKKGEVLNLVNFDPSAYPTLPYPLFQIERGGGLTFHHPGQFVFYPIIKLNPAALSLSKLIDSIFEYTRLTLEDWGVENLDSTHKLLGLWHKDQKLASMGIAIEKLTTYHGMALNIFKDEEMSRALNLLNPCGLSSSTYTSVEELIPMKSHTLDSFTDQFLRRLQDGWK